MTLACDLARQFVSIAVGGMAFAVGISLAVKIPVLLFWSILIVLGLSVSAGLLLQMHAIALVWKGDYDVYGLSFRWISICQILLVALGVFLICIVI